MMGTGEILVILVVILILFGGKKLPEFAQSLGKGIREFKKACNGEDEIPTVHNSSSEKTQDSQQVHLPVDSSHNDRS